MFFNFTAAAMQQEVNMPNNMTPLECLGDLKKRLDPKSFLRLRAETAEFMNMTEKQVAEWFRGKHKPKGERLARLNTLLELLGYRLAGEKNPPVACRQITLLLSFRLLTVAEIAKILGLTHDSVIYLVNARGGTSARKKQIIENLFQKNLPEIQTRERRCREKFAFARLIDRPENFFPSPERIPSTVTPRLDPPTQITLLAHLFQATLPLAKLVASEAFFPEDRELLRELSGRSTVFELKNALVRLCGERARALANQKQEE